MLYIKLFIEREKNIGQSAPECPFKACLNVFNNNSNKNKAAENAITKLGTKLDSPPRCLVHQ